MSTNIGEKQFVWSTAGQAAVGVAFAGANIIKVGLAELNKTKALRVMKNVTHQVNYFFKDKPPAMIATFFADEDLRKFFDPVVNGAEVSSKSKANGVLIDTFDKNCGKSLLDWLSLKEIKSFVKNCHTQNQEAWLAGSITKAQMPGLWKTGVDVICVRGAACESGMGRQAKVIARKVKALMNILSGN